jgi:hypothetical protein
MGKQNIQQCVQPPAAFYRVETKKAECTERCVAAAETDQEEKAKPWAEVNVAGGVGQKVQKSNYEGAGDIDQQGGKRIPGSDRRHPFSDPKAEQATKPAA